MEFWGLEVFGGDYRSIGHKKHEMTQKRASTDVTGAGTDDLAAKRRCGVPLEPSVNFKN